MAKVKPFRGIRPKSELAERIAALPYDVYNRTEASRVVAEEPLSFLKIDRAETQFPETTGTYEPCVYEKARELLDQMIADGAFIQDPEAGYYLYELTMNGRAQTGIVGCAAIDDYENNVIMKHENTRQEKEIDRIRHVDACNAQTGPIFLAYHENKALQEVIGSEKQKAAVYDFISEDGVRHRVWAVTDRAVIVRIENIFMQIQKIYIADGHHRCASAVKVGKKRREETPGYTGDEEFNYFLAVLFQENELHIMDYNRAVKDLNGLTEAAFLERIGERFEVSEAAAEKAVPRQKGQFGMYLKGKWYLLTIKAAYRSADPVAGLDVAILQQQLLQPVLGIADPKTDNRIDFIGGIRGLKELERRVAADCEVAFAMYPTTIQELFQVADAGRLMPPKSTWFEPKLRSGLFVHKLS